MRADQVALDREKVEYVRRHQDHLMGAALFKCRDRELARDLVQETFIKLLNNWKQASTGGRAYASRVLANCHIDHYRRQSVRVQLVGVEPEFLSARASEPQCEDPDDNDAVREAVMQLPAQQREVIRNAYYHDLSFAEIASALGLSPKTVHNYHHAAKAKLKKILKHVHEAQEGAAR